MLMTRLHDKLYAYNDGCKFTLEQGSIGVYGNGTCWRLYQWENGNKNPLGCYCTIDDGYKNYQKDSVNKQLWTLTDILDHVDGIIKFMR